MRRPLVQTAIGQDDDAGWNRTSERTTIFADARSGDDYKTLDAAASCKEPVMTTLVCFGFGYSAQAWLASHSGQFERVWATVRDAAHAVELNARAQSGLTALVFDGAAVSAELRAAIAEADAVLASVPPDAAGDPVLMACGDALGGATHLSSIVYLSTVGVYGNYDGAWVDEDSACRPHLDRDRRRLAAEQSWQAFGARQSVPVAILRLAGIYGPGRSALDNLRRGTARRIAKPGQVFNRIHVADIAQAIAAAFDRRAAGVFNLADDEPTPQGDTIVFAAKLLGIAPPPEIPFAEALPTMSAMAASFYADVKRVRNGKLKSVLGVTLRYPTYRDGLTALARRPDGA
jgi:nucleoside-diphosphate-sugar epimerase